MKIKTAQQTRREFLKLAGAGTLGVALGPSLFAAPSEKQVTRRVFVMSDLHIGKIADGRDGAEWLQRALADVAGHLPDVAYGLTLGDITQEGQADGLDAYLQQTRGSDIPKWFELAGNHEYHQGHIANYTTRIRSTDPMLHIDGNIAWFFLSDEKASRIGNLSDATLTWLKDGLTEHRDKIRIVCSHQLVADTVRRSRESPFQLHPVDKLQRVLDECPVDLWMCGHEHHRPYDRNKIVRKNNTTFINVASMTHAYNTKGSGSTILDFTNGGREIRVRRRDHDQQCFLPELEQTIPLRSACRLS